MNPIHVLAVDAADYELAKDFGCENLLLDSHRELETKTPPGGTMNLPKTGHIWPLIATGMDVEMNINQPEQMTWDSSLWRTLRTLTRPLPMSVRKQLGNIPRLLGASLSFNPDDTGNDPGRTDVFTNSGGTITNWPGVTDVPRLLAAWELCEKLVDGRISERDARLEAVDALYEGIDWLIRQQRYGVPIAGTHVHFLDVAGHAFGNDHDTLRTWYELADHAVGYLRENTDRLVVLSDHGIQVEWVGDDDSPGTHSFRALAASQGIDATLPSHVDDVHGWLADITDSGHGSGRVDAAVDRQHLKELGYLD